MPSFPPDANCMIAAICAWHEFHARAAAELEMRLGRGERVVAVGPALVEAYAVLTRLPAPHRLAAEDALALLDSNFMARRRIVSLDGPSYRALLTAAADAGVAGGQAYDAVIAECVIKSGASVFLTFNPRHFPQLGARQVEVVVPGAHA